MAIPDRPRLDPLQPCEIARGEAVRGAVRTRHVRCEVPDMSLPAPALAEDDARHYGRIAASQRAHAT
jgi:hypothetical protein